MRGVLSKAQPKRIWPVILWPVLLSSIHRTPSSASTWCLEFKSVYPVQPEFLPHSQGMFAMMVVCMRVCVHAFVGVHVYVCM